MNKIYKLKNDIQENEIDTITSAVECFGGTAKYNIKEKTIVIDFNNKKSVEKTVTKFMTDFFSNYKNDENEIILDFRKIKRSNKKNIFNQLIQEQQIVFHDSGLYSYQGQFLKLRTSLEKFILDLTKKFNSVDIEYPNIISVSDLKKTSYLKQFPHFLNFISNKKHLVNPTHVCRSSSCLHTYINYQNKKLSKNIIYTVTGKCTRQEQILESRFERLREFTMREFVFLGEEDFAEARINDSIKICNLVFSQLKLNGYLGVANDMFFPDQLLSLSFFQKTMRAKLELRLFIPAYNETISVASINRHTNYFSGAYNIKGARGSHINTGCFAFGLERLTFAFLSQHGLNERKWPKSIFKYYRT